jgi:GxxExxY protein
MALQKHADAPFEFVELTRRAIGCAYEVHKELGRGFLEKVYVNALANDLRDAGLSAQQEAPVDVVYKERVVGVYYADLLVEGVLICEIKAVQRLIPEHEAQLLNYLKATSKKVGLLLNFGGPSVQVKRMVF